MSQVAYLKIRSLFPTVALACAFFMAFSGVNFMPFWGAAAMKHIGFEESGIGLLGSIEMGSFALASVFGISFLHRIRWNHVAIGSGVAIVLANFFSVFSTSYLMLILLRSLCGLSGGLLASVVATAVSKTSEPAKIMAGVIIGLNVLLFGTLMLVPYAIDFFGMYGAFGFLCLVAAILIVSFVYFPDGVQVDKLVIQKEKIPLVGWVGLIAFWGTISAYFSIYPFIELKGRSIGLSSQDIATITAIAMLFGCLGPLIVHFMINRIGPSTSFLIVLIPFGILQYVMMNSGGVNLFAGSFIGLAILLSSIMPFATGFLVLINSSGRAASFVPAAFSFGAMAGPYIGGIILEDLGFNVLGKFAGGAEAIAIFLLIIAILMYRKNQYQEEISPTS